MCEDEQPRLADDCSLPFISVIIPVLRELKGLKLLIPDLLRQNYPSKRWEIIVADGGDVAATQTLVARFEQANGARIRVLRNHGVRSSAGRNIGIAASAGEIIVFVDGHCRVRNSSFLSVTAQLFQKSDLDCLCRPQPLIGSPNDSMSANIAEVRRSSFGHGRGSMIYDLAFAGVSDPRSSGASYRRSVFDRVGLYDENFDACEDVELNVRVRLSGMLSYSDPRLAVEYEARKSIGALAKQMMRYGRGRIRLARKHNSERSLSSMAPLFLCVLLALPCLAFKSNVVVSILALPALFYTLLVVGASLQLILRTRRVKLAWALLLYPVIHLGLGIGMIMEVCFL
jgi:succinoglycan biosynthesis protein ExoA